MPSPVPPALLVQQYNLASAVEHLEKARQALLAANSDADPVLHLVLQDLLAGLAGPAARATQLLAAVKAALSDN